METAVSAQQRVVSLCLAGYNLQHGRVEEHLADELSRGWRVKDLVSAGGSFGHACATAWVVVLLERASE